MLYEGYGLFLKPRILSGFIGIKFAYPPVFSTIARAVFSLAALIFFWALSTPAATAFNLGPQPKVAVLPSPQLLPPVTEQDVPALTAEDTGNYISWLRKAASLGDAQSAKKLGMLYFEGRDVESDGVAVYVWLYLARHGFSRPAKPKKDDDEESYTSPLKFLAWTMTLQEEREVEAILTAWPKSLPPETPLRNPKMERREHNRNRSELPPPLSPKDTAALHAQAAAGDNAAKVRLGFLHLNGRGMRTDAAKAFLLFTEAADAGDLKALHTMADLYASGEGVEKNPKKARDIYTDLTHKGDVEAQVKLGKALLHKRFEDSSTSDEKTAADERSALELFRKAADHGSISGMFALGSYYRKKEDYDHAAAWYERAAAAGSEGALQARLGIAESQRSAADLYTWMSIWMSCQPPDLRMRIRGLMLQFAGSLPDEKVQQLKQNVDAWLKEHPGVQKAALKRAAENAAYYQDRDERGATALHRAVAANDTLKTEQLLAAKADPNSRDDRGRTPLFAAVEAEGWEATQLLVDAGAVVDAQDAFQQTPLMDAIAANYTEAIRFFLNAGADLRLHNIEGATPLIMAVRQGNAAIVSLLLTAKADPNDTGSRGETPLMTAVLVDKPELVALLLAAGAKPNAQDKDGETALHTAAQKEDSEYIKLLLAAKAAPGLTDKMGKTPLHRAVEHGKLEAVHALLSAGAKPDAHDEDGRTALYIAVKQEQPAMVKALLDAKANPDLFCGKEAETALHAAAQKKGSECIQILLSAKAKPSLTDKTGETPLHRAVERGNLEAVHALLSAGAMPDVLDKNGNSPLIVAAMAGENRTTVLKALLKAKANPNVSGGYHNASPLHYAARSHNLEAVQLLLAANANPDAVDKEGKSALDVASGQAVVSALEKAGAKSRKADSVAIYDELGRPMNKAAEQATQKKTPTVGKDVHILLDGPDQAEAFNETVAQERSGRKSPYLTRAVLMDATVEELAERLKGGQNVNAVDPVFGRALSQALEQRRSIAMVQFLLDHGADPNEDKPLLTALSRRSGEALSLLLAAGADPNTVDSDKTPALILATKKNNLAAVQALLKAGTPVDAPDAKGRTALYHALQNHSGQMDMISLLLANGASPAAFPALLAMNGNADNVPTALLLLEKGAAGTVVGEGGESLLHWAIRAGSPELLAAALKAKAPLNARERYGDTALYMAVRKGKADFVTALLKAGAPVNASVIVPGEKFANYEGVYAAEDDMLPRAVEKGHEDVVKALLAAGVALDTRENTHDRPTALCKAIGEGLPDIVNMILAAGAKPDVADRYGRTPLHHAVRKKDFGSLAALLAAKANPNLQDKDDKTPLYLAAEKSLADMVKAMLTAGAKPDLSDAKNGWTPLHCAAGNNNVEIARMLLAAGANPNTATTQRETPLTLAVSRSGPELIKILLEAGAKVNGHVDFEGGTPLHDAAKKGNVAVVRMLLAAKADPKAKNKEGKTPLDVARNPDVVKILREAGQ